MPMVGINATFLPLSRRAGLLTVLILYDNIVIAMKTVIFKYLEGFFMKNTTMLLLLLVAVSDSLCVSQERLVEGGYAKKDKKTLLNLNEKTLSDESQCDQNAVKNEISLLSDFEKEDLVKRMFLLQTTLKKCEKKEPGITLEKVLIAGLITLCVSRTGILG